MKSREEYNAYMKAYMQQKRDNMTYEEWRAFRDKNNAYKRKKYAERTPEQIEKHKEYQRNKQKLYYFLKKQGR
jgi:hypothetical protein